MVFINSKKIKFLILLAILLTVNFVFNLPYLKNLSAVHRQFTAQENLLIKSAGQQLTPEQILAEYKKTKELLADLDKTLLQKGEELNLIKSLETLAKKYSLKQTIDLSQNTQSASREINKQIMNIKLIGNFNNLLEYLNELNKFSYQLTVNAADLKKGSADLELSLLATTYWFYD